MRALCTIFYEKHFKDVSREFDEFGVILILASCVVGTCNYSMWVSFFEMGGVQFFLFKNIYMLFFSTMTLYPFYDCNSYAALQQ